MHAEQMLMAVGDHIICRIAYHLNGMLDTNNTKRISLSKHTYPSYATYDTNDTNSLKKKSQNLQIKRQEQGHECWGAKIPSATMD
jgi:hypothetical protein